MSPELGGTVTREARMLEKASGRAASEIASTLAAFRSRPDYSQSYDYFLRLAEDMTLEAAEARAGREALRLLCVQAPLELIHAAGLHPFKVFCGSNAAGGLASHGLPALTCPLIRAVAGAVRMTGGAVRPWVLPTTCDWIVHFPEILSLSGVKDASPVHWLELPHLKDGDEGRRRWLDEIYGLKKFLEARVGRGVKQAALARSVAVYQRAWRALTALSNLRRSGRLSSAWFMLIAGVFFCDSPEAWAGAAERVIDSPGDPVPGGRKIFLAGSPIFFPNFKVPFLIEEAGLNVVSDDLCSSERIFPGAASYTDSSEYGLVSALSERYHQGCICPTFIDNDRRVNNIIGQMRGSGFLGVAFHVLKGCHPYDLESFGVEFRLKERGLKFIRLETDYSAEDDRTLSTRLEAFRRTMEDG
jgi:benzoyl-CoA reductase/2-hydroxyglutaryl-CoA dehydratase subunit BcrC/BadD/HgdB